MPFVYDAVGNMTEDKTANGTQVHKYTYDKLNRLTKYTDALNNSENYTYDPNQDMIKKVDRNGNAVTYTYDGLHRVLTETADGVNNSWTYGLTGGVLTEINDNAQKTYTYNNKGLVSAETTKIGNDTFKISRFYDTRGNNTQDHYYKNGAVYEKRQYVYDNKNRLAGVGVAAGTSSSFTRKVTYYYDKNDNLSSAHYDNNTYDVYYYNAANLIHCMDLVNKSDDSKLEHLVYRYRLDGNMSGKTETYNGYTNTTAYTYDSTGRLTNEAVSGSDNFGISYSYDNAGNRSSMTLSGNAGSYTENYTYDKNNRLTASSINYGVRTDFTDYTYDKNGNQTKVEKHSRNNSGTFKLSIVNATYKGASGVERFTYNGLNQLTNYESTNGQYNGKVGYTAEYKYMANGYRLSKSVNGIETRYLWDNDNIVAELNDINVISQKYYRGYNLICDDSNIYYMHDPHGNVIETYQGNNNYADDWYMYNAFGTNKYFDDTGVPSKWGYCDQLKDFETGNYYMRARYYNPESGRFISEDTHWNPSNMIYGDRTFEEDETKYPDITASLQASNLYGYCMGNPIVFVDILGLAGYKVKVTQWVDVQAESLSYVSSNITWDGKTSTATVTMSNDSFSVTKSFTNNVDGNYIIDGKLYVDEDELWKTFGLVVDPPIETHPIIDTIVIATTITLIIKGIPIIIGLAKSAAADISNDIINSVRVGSALKLDPYHNFTDIIDNYAGYATKSSLKGGDGIIRTLYKLEGSLNGREGVFEWILDSRTGVTHRFFRPY